MTSCEKIQEMISSMLDGQLNEHERTEVEEHIAHCSECAAMYEDFSALSISMKEEFSAVPATLHDKIMSGVKARRKKAKIIPLRAYLSTAACLVLVVGAVLAVGNGRSHDSASLAEPAAAPAAAAPMAPDMEYFAAERNESAYGMAAPPIPDDAAPIEIPAPTIDPSFVDSPAEPVAPESPAEPVAPFWERGLSSRAYIPGTKIDSAFYEYSASSFITGCGYADTEVLAALLEKADFDFDSHQLPEKADAFIELQCGIEYMNIRLYFIGEQVIIETIEGYYPAIGTASQFLEIFQ